LHEPVKFYDFVIEEDDDRNKFIAHCEEESKQSLMGSVIQPSIDKLILIGPEGDFTKEEIAHSITNDFIPVSLGNTRLRTETAGIVAATLLCTNR
jgi:16S rRNA (uracil1498-N3)-methyltransferase